MREVKNKANNKIKINQNSNKVLMFWKFYNT